MPAQQRDQQQQTENTATRDQASEIPSWPIHIEIASVSNILVGSLLRVCALPTANVRQATCPSTASATHSACTAIPSGSTRTSTTSVGSTTIHAATPTKAATSTKAATTEAASPCV